MSPDTPSSPNICPTCGTRLSVDATRCLVCGTELAPRSEKAGRPQKAAVQGSRMPEITLSLPAALGLLVLFIAIGAVLLYFAMQQLAPPPPEATVTPTITLTPTVTTTATQLPPTITNTPEPSPTPFQYSVKLGDTCGGIAFAFNVSVQSIVLLNNLPADCSTLTEGQALKIPQPTPTATALPTATLSPDKATVEACEKLPYTVQENDTLGGIALNYNIPPEAIAEFNGLVNNVVRFGQQLILPLCKRNATPGATPTPTLPPPYPAPNLLLPSDGAPFNPAEGVIALQWASVGTLRTNESYAVTLEDITDGQGRRRVEYVVDTRFIVPQDFLPADGVPHVIRWWVLAVRQVGTDNDGNPIWEPAGAASTPRVFSWSSSGAPQTTPAPQ